MIAIRRARERQHERHWQQEAWLTFSPQEQTDPLSDGFPAIEILSEHCLPPNASVGHPHHAAEILTYVREGALAYEDSTGRAGLIRAGEFQRLTAGGLVRHTETNSSKVDWAHVFQLWLRPSDTDLEAGLEQKRFSTAERRGLLCVVASPDGRRGSLRVHQDVLVCSAMLGPGQHVVHELCRGRRAWLQLVHGEVTLGDLVLAAGDGAGISLERTVSFTAREETEILLLDLGELRPPAAILETHCLPSPLSSPRVLHIE